jgi:NAD(P)-dependent dehydrogenase (short-subunit alcohol dehydrogenase family)
MDRAVGGDQFKGAVKLSSKHTAIEFAALGYNIRVNSVHPGRVDTDLLNLMMQRYVEIGAVKSTESAASHFFLPQFSAQVAMAEITGIEQPGSKVWRDQIPI